MKVAGNIVTLVCGELYETLKFGGNFSSAILGYDKYWTRQLNLPNGVYNFIIAMSCLYRRNTKANCVHSILNDLVIKRAQYNYCLIMCPKIVHIVV